MGAYSQEAAGLEGGEATNDVSTCIICRQEVAPSTEPIPDVKEFQLTVVDFLLDNVVRASDPVRKKAREVGDVLRLFSMCSSCHTHAVDAIRAHPNSEKYCKVLREKMQAVLKHSPGPNPILLGYEMWSPEERELMRRVEILEKSGRVMEKPEEDVYTGGENAGGGDGETPMPPSEGNQDGDGNEGTASQQNSLRRSGRKRKNAYERDPAYYYPGTTGPDVDVFLVRKSKRLLKKSPHPKVVLKRLTFPIPRTAVVECEEENCPGSDAEKIAGKSAQGPVARQADILQQLVEMAQIVEVKEEPVPECGLCGAHFWEMERLQFHLCTQHGATNPNFPKCDSHGCTHICWNEEEMEEHRKLHP